MKQDSSKPIMMATVYVLHRELGSEKATDIINKIIEKVPEAKMFLKELANENFSSLDR